MTTHYTIHDTVPPPARSGDRIIVEGETFTVMVHPQATRWERLALRLVPSWALSWWPFRRLRYRMLWVGEVQYREVIE